jgi:hypothetical protein
VPSWGGRAHRLGARARRRRDLDGARSEREARQCSQLVAQRGGGVEQRRRRVGLAQPKACGGTNTPFDIFRAVLCSARIGMDAPHVDGKERRDVTELEGCALF